MFENSGCGTCVLLEEYPEIDYALVWRDSKLSPFVAAWGLDKATGSWCQGHYFAKLDDALSFISLKRAVSFCP